IPATRIGDEIIEPGLELHLRRLPFDSLLGSRALRFALALLDELGPRLALTVLTHDHHSAIVTQSARSRPLRAPRVAAHRANSTKQAPSRADAERRANQSARSAVR